MVFCYLYELFWEMHLLFWEFQFWSEKCIKATEKNCKPNVVITYYTNLVFETVIMWTENMCNWIKALHQVLKEWQAVWSVWIFVLRVLKKYTLLVKLVPKRATKTVKGSYYALLQSLDFVWGCTRTCSHAWWFESRIIFHIIYIITIPFSPTWHKWLD